MNDSYINKNDIFRGYTHDDMKYIKALSDTNTQPSPESFVNYFGVSTHRDVCPWIHDKLGTVSREIPIHDDGVLCGILEYICAGIALESSSNRNRKEFNIVELGAGWGPWVSFFHIASKKFGFNKCNCIGVEADSSRFALMQKHLFENKILKSVKSTINITEYGRVELINSAVWYENKTLYWPSERDSSDAGMSIETSIEKKKDYRGLDVDHVPIKAISILDIIEKHEIIDLLHFDVQGVEYEIIHKTIETINNKCLSMFFGTHSRKIEGDLMDILYRNGWTLEREKPCQFYNLAPFSGDLRQLTYEDGAQLWVNRNI